MSNDSEFSTRSGHLLLKSETSHRVSEDAGDELAELLEEHGSEIAEQAVKYAESAGRITVKAEDINRAIRTLK